ncbi:unnamed protein product [Soboliphyme baturini]|uniref:HOOK domain-containing protein n=1 Tax=Soboliphyme baturini TaxID=241478 RepID=A0A183J4C9_9BILA|nr:unnamed protein product [Soboliphyme baturini]
MGKEYHELRAELVEAYELPMKTKTLREDLSVLDSHLQKEQSYLKAKENDVEEVKKQIQLLKAKQEELKKETERNQQIIASQPVSSEEMKRLSLQNQENRYYLASLKAEEAAKASKVDEIDMYCNEMDDNVRLLFFL